MVLPGYFRACMAFFERLRILTVKKLTQCVYIIYKLWLLAHSCRTLAGVGVNPQCTNVRLATLGMLSLCYNYPPCSSSF